ncbi:MAG: hypothetical protein ACK4E0_10175 [Chitinophagaceae bacterium]
MKRIIYTAIFVAGLFVGMFKGQDVRQRWVAKMKGRPDDNKPIMQVPSEEINLDEYELEAWHS